MTTAMTKKQVTLPRYFTKDGGGKTPYEMVVWEKRTAKVTGATGEVIFEQKDVEVPASWSQSATNIVASKYFWGKMGDPKRENSVRQLVVRVVNAIATSGFEQGYFDQITAGVFADELAFLLLNQYGAFNSPVWFNVGLDKLDSSSRASSWHWNHAGVDPAVVKTNSGYKNPQCSACFINGIEDSMESIMKLATTEAMLFKWGSGSGTNFSSLRSSKEGVSGGGLASGPLSFMKGLDAFAGVIKSGGKTRRAAKMAILNADHPDIEEFIDCKLKEDKKAQALMREGYDGTSGPDSEAYSSVFYQNANNSVRASNEFMGWAGAVDERGGYLPTWTLNAVKDGSVVKTVVARDLLRKIAEAAYECGDPGMQFDDTINKWHTCKESGRINASNPCSEYMFLDNSACNLASLNLLKFMEHQVFHADPFKHAVILFILAQDILVDMSGYPTEEIAKNSHDYRPLGLGYANLGAALMSKGLAYDSDAGRAWAAVITAIMTGQAYLTSAWLAENMLPLVPAVGLRPTGSTDAGCFPGYLKNNESMLEVIGQHKRAIDDIDKSLVSDDLMNEAKWIWNMAQNIGKIHGFRNAQVTVLAPTGTIGFMMDCDTTGIEPELALVKYKKLVGGGQMKIVNETVTEALLNLGYDHQQANDFIVYIDKFGCLEGSLSLRPEHLSIFDTAFRPQNGTRSIHYMGHIKMMASVQPFLSGAISKTVNMPNEATVEEIAKAYWQAWTLGLKSVAIYRDGSKSNQVLVTKKDVITAEDWPHGSKVVSAMHQPIGGLVEARALVPILEHTDPKAWEDLAVKELMSTLGFKPASLYIHDAIEFSAKPEDLGAPPNSVRHRLPDTRPAYTHKFTIAGHDGYLTVGLYKNGAPGEIFVAMAKEGSTISGFMDSFALVFSIALQHGVPLETLVSKLSHTRFEPSGWTQNPDIGYAKSIMDYIARWLSIQFLKQPAKPILDPNETPAEPVSGSEVQSLSSVVEMSDAPACPDCGCITVRSGSCYKCLECGGSTGCS